MTQKCNHDEQLLDYVYGELSDAERKIFADHLATCSTCPAQVESFGGIRKEFQARPPIEPAGESMQRMTALLMQAATEQQGKAVGAVPDGGGKVLGFRSRGLRRILFHPAGGVMAMAAAALFWVVFRAQPGPQAGLPAPTAPTAFEAPRGTEGAPAPVAAPAASTTTLAAAKPAPDVVAQNALPTAPAKEAEKARAEATVDRNLEAPGRGGLVGDKTVVAHKDKDEALNAGDFAGLRARLREADSAADGAKDEKKVQQASRPPMLAAKPTKPAEPSAKPMVMAKLDPPAPAIRAAAGKGGSAAPRDGEAQYRSSGPAVVAMADQAYQRAGKKSAGYEAPRATESWTTPPAAQPSPPPPPATARPSSDEEPASVREGIARTEERRKQKVVDALSNQELGTMAGGAPGSAPSVSAQANENRYAQQGLRYDTSSTSPTGNADDAQTPAATATQPAVNMPARGAATGAAADEGAAALTTAKEQLRRGQCSDANATLTRLERTLPTLHGLPETRAEWQSSCATATPQYFERRQNNEAPESPAPASAPPAPYRMSKSHMSSPMPAKAAQRKPAPKAPAKAAADAL